mgnify:CR=1 FL=1
MEKKRLAYVNYWNHRYYKSGDFLREILSEEFEITDFWWKPNEKIPLDEINKFENIFLTQKFSDILWSILMSRYFAEAKQIVPTSR